LAFAPFIVGVAFLAIRQAGDRHYPMKTLKAAEYIALLLSVLTAFYNPLLAVLILSANAAVFLWRSIRESSFLFQLYFLILVTAATVIAAIKLLGHERMLIAGLISVSLVGMYRWLCRCENRSAESRLTFIWAQVLALSAIVLEAVYGNFSPFVFLIVWAGFLLVTELRRAPIAEKTSAQPQHRWMRMVGYWVAHLAGAVWLISMLKFLGIDLSYAALALVLWTSAHVQVAGLLEKRLPGRVVTDATRLAVHGLVLLALLFLVTASSGLVIVVTLLVSGILYFQLPVRFLGSSNNQKSADQPLSGNTGAGVTASRQQKVLRTIANALTLAAVIYASTDSVKLTTMALFFSALVYLWRSAREQSYRPHFLFLSLATIAVGLAVFNLFDKPAVLILSFLSVGLLGVYQWLLTVKVRYREAQLTLKWAVIAGVGSIIIEAVWGQFSPLVFLPIWSGFLIGLKASKEREGWTSAHSVDVENRQLRIAGYWVAHTAGACWLSAMALTSGIAASYQAVALAVWAWIHFGVYQLMARRASGRVRTIATLQAVHGFSFFSLLLALIYAQDALLSMVACSITGSLYLVLRLTSSQKTLGDVAVFAFIEVISLLGAQWEIALPDFYLAVIGLYLCFILPRRFDNQTLKKPEAGKKQWQAFLQENFLTLLVMLMLVIYPFWALVQSLHSVHIFLLGGATVALLFLFMQSRRPPVLIYLVSLFFVIGAGYLLVFGQPDQWVHMFLVLIGALIITNQVFIGTQEQRKVSG
jgi:hypothetical protein